MFTFKKIGEINPDTSRPDSACGRSYCESDMTTCKYHRGYFKKDKKSKD